MSRSSQHFAGPVRGHIAASGIGIWSTHRIRAVPNTIARVAEGAATIAAASSGIVSAPQLFKTTRVILPIAASKRGFPRSSSASAR
jgi:hypothetical protein